MSLRALGNLSYCDENIRYLVDSGAVEVIVQGMIANASAKQAIQYSLEVRVGVNACLDVRVRCVCVCELRR